MNEEIAFVSIENEGWPDIEVADLGGAHGNWRAFIQIEDKVYSTVDHETPDQAVAYLERMLIQELCVPGPGPTNRRQNPGRRYYDTPHPEEGMMQLWGHLGRREEDIWE